MGWALDAEFVIVGAGFGGLAAAVRLAHRGKSVLVVEKNEFVGGRNHTHRVGACRFDSGPTLLMMLDPFRKLFADVGEDFDTRLKPRLCDPSYRTWFADGSTIDATTDQGVMEERIRQLSGPRDAARFRPFMERLKDLYEDAIPAFVRRNYRSVWDFAAPSQLRTALKHGMLGSLSRRVEKTFEDPRLRMLFSFQTMYLGLSPFDAPWVYSTLAYMEYGQGIFYPEGGLGRMSEVLREMAEARGAKFRLGESVVEISGTSVKLASGETLTAKHVVANADLPYVESSLVKPSRPPKYRNSCSAHVMYIDYEGELPDLAHHNVFFGSDFRGNLDSLFHDLSYPSDPAFYACLASQSDPSCCTEGHSSLFLLVPVPNLQRPAEEDEECVLEKSVFARLTAKAGFDPRRIRAISRRTPSSWEREFNLHQGAAFGISADLFQSAFMRPQNKLKRPDGVYLVGASTVPGNGLPMVLISAELLEDRFLSEGLL